MRCAWAAPPTCTSRGLRAHQGVNAHVQGLTCEQHSTTDTTAPKTQTTSPTTTRFHRFLPRWSALCALHQPKPRSDFHQTGEMASLEIRHAASQPLMLQNPHRNRRGGHRATSAPKAPPVRRAPEGPRGLAAVPAARGRRGLAGQRAEAPIEARGADGRSGRHRHHRQPNLACNSPATRIDTSSKTTEYQRLESKPRHALTGIACGIDG